MGVLRHEAAGGIILTASHNPEQWNALKLLNGKSEFLDAEQGSDVLKIADEKSFDYKLFDEIGAVHSDDDIIDYHIDKILALSYIDEEQIRKKSFKIAVDAVNGAGSHALPALLKRLGAEVHELHCEPTGIFPHNPEPLPEHLTEISEYVVENSCDFGLVTDPDADRLAIIDENGKMFGEEYTQVAAFDFLLSKKSGDTATNLSSSRAAEEITKKHGGTCHRTAVGEINVVKGMQKHGAIISGEGNGGVINPDLHPGRDALVGSAMFLQLMAANGMLVSEYRAGLPNYEMVKQKVALADLGMDADDVLKRIADTFTGYNPNLTDGVKIDFDNGWVHFRKSNTEPIVRIYSEAADEKTARELASDVLSHIQA
jgi:phosphomannomutase